MKRISEIQLPQPNYDLKDFLLALGFLTPSGMTLEQFITDARSKIPQGTGFAQDDATPAQPLESNLAQVPGITTTITYKRQAPIEKIDAQEWPEEYSHFPIDTMPTHGPSRPFQMASAPIGQMGSPQLNGGLGTYADNVKKRVGERIAKREARADGKVEIHLGEDVGPFSAGTIFTFARLV